MNNGIALIIPNADFSGSPLGQVTFVKTPAEIVGEYLTKVGVEKNRLELTTLYGKLSELGVIETVDIFPMLGNSLSNRLIGLKQSDDAYVFDKLLVGANASIDATDGIEFADTNPNITGEEAGYKDTLLPNIDNLFVFMRVAPRRLGLGYCCRYDMGGSYADLELESTQGQDTSYHEALHFRQLGKTQTFESSVYNKIALDVPNLYFARYNEGYKTYFGKNVELLHTAAPVASLPQPINVSNAFGGCINDAGASHYFNAHVDMFAVGTVPADKFQDVCDAFVEYFE